MDVVLVFVFIIIGFIVTAISFTNVICMLVCGFPCAKTLTKCGVVRDNAINVLKKRNIRAFIIHSVIFLASIIVVFVFFEKFFVSYLIGIGFALIFSLQSFRISVNTIADYLETTEKYLTAKGYPLKPIFKKIPQLTKKQQLIYSVIGQAFPVEIDMHHFDCAYLRIKDYADGLYDNEPSHNQGRLFLLNFRCIGFCLGWCIFHANAEKQNKLLATKNLYYDKVKRNSNDPQKMENFIKETENMYLLAAQEMVKFKKTVVDPSYKEDSSTENYNRLLKLFLELVCELNEIEWYDGIVEDFKHCMDE